MPAIDQMVAQAAADKDRYLTELQEVLKIPSVSTLSDHADDIRRCAAWLAEQLEAVGMDKTEIMETGGHPLIYSEWLNKPGQPTMLVYGHYDVQPADPIEEWDSPPFEPTIEGDYIFARGASDMKSQIFGQIKAMESFGGDFPINIKYLIEGEEEIGSKNLGAFIENHRDLLACDFVLNCDAFIRAPDQPAILYSLRGLTYFEIEIRAMQRDLHSGRFGGSVPNPVHVLSGLIAGLHDENGRIMLPGFYDNVRELDAEEREALARLPYSDEEWLHVSTAKTLTGEAGYSTIERIGARPALDVNGIWGGFTGEGSKTVIPAAAYAKLSARLVADQKHTDVTDQLRAYLDANVPDGIDYTITELVHGPGAIMDRHSPYMKRAVAALEAVFGTKPLFSREGGSVPVVGMMQETLGVDSIMLGFALPDDGIHGPNERQYIPNFYKGIETYIRFLAGFDQ